MDNKLSINTFNNVCNSLKIHRHLYIGYSGGIDSAVLLDLCCKSLINMFVIKVIYVDHSYSKKSVLWKNFCKHICNKYKIPLYTFKVYENYNYSNLESVFRDLRFNLFLSFISKNCTFFFAHHLDDLLETFILKTFRGSGLNSSVGIQHTSKIGHLNIVRPLLNFTRKHIFNYAVDCSLYYINDFSNFNNDFLRNYLRNVIKPKLPNSWLKSILALRYNNLLNTNLRYVINHSEFFIVSKGLRYKSLSLDFLNKVGVDFKYEILRLWIKINGYNVPSQTQLFEINKIIKSNNLCMARIKIGYYIIVKVKKNIYIFDFVEDRFFYCQYKFVYINIFTNNVIVQYIYNISFSKKYFKNF